MTAVKLDPEFKAKWVAALRSGNYQQGRCAMRAGDKFCCLGVACDILDPNGWEKMESSDEYFAHHGEGGLPSHEMRKAMGFGKDEEHLFIPAVTIDGELRTLHNHNDAGVPFSKIADAIEAQL